MKALLSTVSCFIVDEAHHFPHDTQKELKIYGRIYEIAKEYIQGTVLSMTGTWERLDKKMVMGVAEPDSRLTVQDAVDLGRCPEIYGIQVILDIVAEGVKTTGDLYDYHLGETEKQKYYEAFLSLDVLFLK